MIVVSRLVVMAVSTWSIAVISILLIGNQNHAFAATVEYNFENSAEVNDFVVPSTSVLATDGTRHKLGMNSLKWTYAGNQILSLNLSSKNIEGTSIRSGGMKFWIYNDESMDLKCFTVKITTTENAQTTDTCPGGITHTSQFHISLAFTGWRGIWIGYTDFQNCPTAYPSKNSACTYEAKKISKMEMQAPDVTGSKIVYIDALRFYDKIKSQSSDEIVPLVVSRCLTCETINTVTEEEALAEYSRSDFWQQTYRWGAVVPVPALPTTPLGGTELASKLSDLRLIEKRFDYWYADEKTTFVKLELTTSPAYPTGVVTDNFYLRKRWDDLMDNVNKAYEEFRNLQISKSNNIITGSGLFVQSISKGVAKKGGADVGEMNLRPVADWIKIVEQNIIQYGNSETAGGDKKFGLVMHKVLLPLALEYYLKSRPLEVSNTVCQWSKIYSSSTTPNADDSNLIAVVGTDTQMKQAFTTAYTAHTGAETPPAECTGASSASYSKIKHAVTELNKKRKDNLLLLFEYLEDQGWTKGSAAGTTSHEMNRSGAGFANSVFILRKILQENGKLESAIATLKWYTDFNEVYQSPSYEFKGTTADRMRTILLFRLMAVLMMPEEASSAAVKPKANAKVRDMEQWKRWYDNAVSINEGMGGVIKPDFTGFHHLGFYGPAYIPHALHCAAIARFMIDGTSFASGPTDSTSKENLKNALDLMKIVSVKYSTPNSIAGRFPGYYRAIMAKTVAPFAYLAVASPSFASGSQTELGDLGSLKTSEAKAFLRLYDVGTTQNCGENETANDFAMREFKADLCDGRFGSPIYYYNSLGSLQIMQKVRAKADGQSLVKENSPVGHWAKNFAAMSIHRREDWAVTMKGFNKFVWDTEISSNQNVFGLYQSHGALQISNSEEELRRFDIEKGWDWRKIPGTTTIGFNIPDLKTMNNRRLNPRELAGGVTFSGKNSYSLATLNGAFGQDFTQPSYSLPDNSPMENVAFSFKKSVFFEDDFLVALGTNIDTSVRSNEKTYTTLFQNKLLQSDTFSSANPEIFKCGNASSARVPDAWGPASSVVLEDVVGNRYFVKNPRDRGLYFEPRTMQTSYRSNGKTTATTMAEYCTAWFDHGSSPSGQSYEYAIQVKGSSPFTTSLSASDYTVLQNAEKAHVIKISKTDSNRPLYGYVVFGTSSGKLSDGPISSVRKGPGIVMARYITSSRLAISVSYPNPKLERDDDRPQWCSNTSFPNLPTIASRFGDEYKYCASSASEDVRVVLQGSVFSYTVSHIYVNGEEKNPSNKESNDYLIVRGNRRTVDFKNLKNGYTTEIWLSQTSSS